MHKKLTLFAAAIALLFSAMAFALDLGTAKRQGLVGETPSGYLAAVKPPSPEVKQLIKRINSQRRQKYQAIAKKNGISLKEVEALAGKKAIEKTPRGQYVKVGGGWRRK